MAIGVMSMTLYWKNLSIRSERHDGGGHKAVVAQWNEITKWCITHEKIIQRISTMSISVAGDVASIGCRSMHMPQGENTNQTAGVVAHWHGIVNSVRIWSELTASSHRILASIKIAWNRWIRVRRPHIRTASITNFSNWHHLYNSQLRR